VLTEGENKKAVSRKRRNCEKRRREDRVEDGGNLSNGARGEKTQQTQRSNYSA